MSSVAETIAAGARAESERLGGRAARRARLGAGLLAARPRRRSRLGLETVYEAYLVHYGRPRLFAAADPDEAVLLGDYLYAHGLVRVAEAGGVDAVAVLAELDLALRGAARRRQAPATATRGSTPPVRSAARPATTRSSSALARHSARVAA